MKVEVRPEKAYGKVRYYATNSVAEALLSVMNRKSFTKKQLKYLKSQGYEIEIVTVEQRSDEHEI
jgi:hypothetical protein